MAEGCLRVGQAAPDFTATAVSDREFKTVRLSWQICCLILLSPRLYICLPDRDYCF
jgi:hypothetical protein